MAYVEWITKEAYLDYYLTNKTSGFKYHEDSIFNSINEAIDAVVEADLYEPAVSLINIENYRGRLPINFTRTIQVLYRDIKHPSHKKLDSYSRSHIVEWTKDLFGSQDCELVTTLVCPTCHEPDCRCKTSTIKLASAEAELRFPEIVANLTRASRVVSDNPESPFYVHFHKKSKDWRWIRPASNHFFNHSYHIGDCVNFGIETDTEYRIERPFIQVNEPFGQVLMACMLKKGDEQGYRLIPNEPIVFRLLNLWIESDRAMASYLESKDPKDERAWQLLDAKRTSLLGTARAEINAAEYDEQEVYIQNFWKKFVAPVDYQKNLGRLTNEKYKFRNAR